MGARLRRWLMHDPKRSAWVDTLDAFACPFHVSDLASSVPRAYKLP